LFQEIVQPNASKIRRKARRASNNVDLILVEQATVLTALKATDWKGDSVSARLRRARLVKGMIITKLAELAGFILSTVSEAERGCVTPSVSVKHSPPGLIFRLVG